MIVLTTSAMRCVGTGMLPLPVGATAACPPTRIAHMRPTIDSIIEQTYKPDNRMVVRHETQKARGRARVEQRVGSRRAVTTSL